MMKRNYFFCLLGMALLSGCHSGQEREIVREKATAQVLHNSIIARFLGIKTLVI